MDVYALCLTASLPSKRQKRRKRIPHSAAQLNVRDLKVCSHAVLLSTFPLLRVRLRRVRAKRASLPVWYLEQYVGEARATFLPVMSKLLSVPLLSPMMRSANHTK